MCINIDFYPNIYTCIYLHYHPVFSDPIISASDGWGDRHHPDPNRLVSSEVTVRVLAWSFDNAPASCRWMEKSSFTITESTIDAPRMLFLHSRNIDASLVVVSVSDQNFFFGINSNPKPPKKPTLSITAPS